MGGYFFKMPKTLERVRANRNEFSQVRVFDDESRDLDCMVLTNGQPF